MVCWTLCREFSHLTEIRQTRIDELLNFMPQVREVSQPRNINALSFEKYLFLHTIRLKTCAEFEWKITIRPLKCTLYFALMEIPIVFTRLLVGRDCDDPPLLQVTACSIWLFLMYFYKTKRRNNICLKKFFLLRWIRLIYFILLVIDWNVNRNNIEVYSR